LKLLAVRKTYYKHQWVFQKERMTKIETNVFNMAFSGEVARDLLLFLVDPFSPLVLFKARNAK